MISLVPSESWGASSGSGLLPENGVWGHAPARLAGQRLRRRPDKCDAGRRPSGRRIPRPAASGRTRSLCRSSSSHRNRFAGFRREPCWGGNKNSRFAFFRHFYVGEILLPSGRCGCVGITPRGVVSAEKTAFSEWGLCADERAVPSCTQRFFGTSMRGGWYHYPRRALHAIEALDARGSRRRIRRFYAAPVLALCGLNIPSAGTHATPAPNRAHSGSHAETRGVLRVDGDDVSGSGIIDTIDPFQADQTVAVALAEGQRNAVSP